MTTVGSPGGSSKRAEVIDIVDPSRTCNSLQDFPEDSTWNPPGAILNGSLVVCGYHKCYKYENDKWSKIGPDYNPSRVLSSGSVIKGKCELYVVILHLNS